MRYRPGTARTGLEGHHRGLVHVAVRGGAPRSARSARSEGVRNQPGRNLTCSSRPCSEVRAHSSSETQPFENVVAGRRPSDAPGVRGRKAGEGVAGPHAPRGVAERAEHAAHEDDGPAAPHASLDEVPGDATPNHVHDRSLEVVQASEADHRLGVGRPVAALLARRGIERGLVREPQACGRREYGDRPEEEPLQRARGRLRRLPRRARDEARERPLQEIEVEALRLVEGRGRHRRVGRVGSARHASGVCSEVASGSSGSLPGRTPPQ
jgi:hypothetical protein